MRTNPLRRSKETSMKVKKELHTITQQLKKHKSQDTYTNQRSVHKDIPNKYILTEKSPTLSKEYIPQNKINMNMNINISPRLVSPNKQTTPRTSPHVTTTHMNTHTHNAHVKLGSLDKIMSDDESCQEIDSDETEKSNNNIHNSNSSIIDETEISEMNCELYPTNNVINSINSNNNSNNDKCHINKFPTLSSNPFTESKHNNTLPKPAIVTVNLDDNAYTTNTNTNTNTNEQLDTLLRSMLVIAKKGDKESLLDLLEKILHYPQCDLNFKDENGFTALHYACDEGNFKIADILIKSNCDVNAKTTTNKKTPLHLTAQRGFFDISKLLIENGAIVNIGDNEKNTPLHLCAMGGHVELMKFFLDKLPQADVKNIYGKTPKDVAMKAEIKELLKEYLDKKDNVYRNIKIHTTSESTLNYMMKKFHSGTQKSNKVMVHNTHNHININIQTNYNNSNSNSGNSGNGCMHDVSKNNSVDNTTTSGKAVCKRTTLPNTSATKLRYIKQTNANGSGNGNGGILPLSVSSSNSVSKKHIPLPNKHNNNAQQQLCDTTNTAISKKNSISNFSMNSQLTNRKVTPNPQKQNLHKTRTLQKFVSSNHNNHSTSTSNGAATSKKECSSLSSSKKQFHPKPNNTNTSTSMNPKFNISVDINDPLYRLNKTEELSKPFKTNPNDITTTNDNDNDDNTTTNNNTKYNHQVSLGSIEEERITLTSFICLAMLGRGSFGEVYLVQKTSSKVLYAMKVLSKDRIMGQNLMKYAMAERNVLSLTNHPFIVKLNFAFQTNHKLFLILDYCAGGDLAKHLQYEKRFSEERARFYLCEIILALEDLHKRDIIFRDLKPDNVVLDNEGHAKLTDFGLSKEGVFDSQCAKSFCGSIAYLAPEMLKKQGHGKAVDWYLLGVLFYEMLVGIPPFFTEQKEEIFRNIEHGELIIPKKVSKEAATLLRGLLQKDPNKRLGSVKDACEVKEHKYFKKVNWEDVYHKRIPTPKMRNYAKHLQMYNHPRMFQADEQDYSNVDTVLPGWSFINNDDI